jgi:hypothetical protein
LPLWARLFLLFPALMVAGAVIAPLPPFPSWPLDATMGGSVGYAVLHLAAQPLAGFLGRRRDLDRPARPGGDALRTRARARHQIVARDRPCRRHRALDERAVGPRRGGARPQRHRHRTAEPAREKVYLRELLAVKDGNESVASCR